jgi:hypothetical protein
VKKIYLPLVVVSLYLLSGCSKDSGDTTQVIRVSNARFATSVVPNIAASYTNLACVTTDSLPGTECVDAKGSSCKTLQGCTAVSTDIQSGRYTQGEIDQRIRLVKKAFGIKYTY